MPPRKKAPTTSKKAAPAKGKSAGKKTTHPSAKTATTNKRTTRTSLRERSSDVAISVDEEEPEADGIASPAVQVDEADEAPAPRPSPFPDEVLKRIFGFCLEEEKEGCYVAQKTLAILLKVNNLFLKIARPILYRSPTVINTESFFLGSHRSLRDDMPYFFGPTNEPGGMLGYFRRCIGGKDTKLPLLDKVRHLRLLSPIVPKFVDGEEQPITRDYLKTFLEDDRYVEGDIYDETLEILEINRVKRLITPNLDSLSVGSTMRIDLEDYKDDKDIMNGIVNVELQLGLGILTLREDLWKRCQPVEWVEYQKEITGTYRPEKLKRSPMRSNRHSREDQYIPEIHACHTTLLEPFWVIWGSINKLILRKTTEKDIQWNKMFWNYLVDKGYKTAEMMESLRSSEDHVRLFYMDVDEMNTERTKNLIVNTLSFSHPNRFTIPKITAKLKRKLEDETALEVYGYEVVHGLESQDQYDEIWSRRKEIIEKDWKKDKKVDMAYVKEQIELDGYNIENDEFNAPRRQVQQPFEDEIEIDIDESTPLCNEEKQQRLKEAKVRFWLTFQDREIIRSLQSIFKYKDRKWTNGNESEGFIVRFRPMCNMLAPGQSCVQKRLDPEWDNTDHFFVL